MSTPNTPKLEVGKWYDVYNGSAGGKLCQLIEILKDGEGMFYSPNDNGPRQYSVPTSSGPYHIEPGDTVRPKPAGDKCWEVVPKEYVGWVFKWFGDGIKVHHLSVHAWYNKEHQVAAGPDTGYVPLSCLILVRKGEQKAQSEEETPRVWVRPGDAYTISTPNGMKTYENHSDKAVEVEFCHNTGIFRIFRQVNKAAGVGPTESRTPNKGFSQASPAAPKLNPGVLPSLSGSDLVWPDVKPEHKKDLGDVCKISSEDISGNIGSGLSVKRIHTALEFLCEGIGNTNNADRAKIAALIPQIERKLAQLKGRVGGSGVQRVAAWSKKQ